MRHGETRTTRSQSDQSDAAGFLSTLRRRVRVREVLALVVVPAVLVAVFTLPEQMRSSLAFAYHRPTLVDAYTSHFVHFSADHLLANVLGYLLLAGSGYVVAVLADAKRLFGAAVTTCLTVFPFAISGLNLAVPRTAIGYGFSGVAMSLAGLLVVVVTLYARRRLHPEVRVQHAPVGFFLTLSVIAVVALPSTAVSWGLVAVTAVCTLWYTTVVVRDLNGHSPAPTVRDPGWLELFGLAAVVIVGYVVVGFPAELRSGGAVVNVYAHAIGFSLAFLVTYVTAELGVFETGR